MLASTLIYATQLGLVLRPDLAFPRVRDQGRFLVVLPNLMVYFGAEGMGGSERAKYCMRKMGVVVVRVGRLVGSGVVKQRDMWAADKC